MEIVQVALGPVAGVVAFVVSAVAHLAIGRHLRLGTALVTGLGVGVVVSIVQALQYGRAGPAWLRDVQGMLPHREADMLPGQPERQWPTLRELVRVVAIGQTRALDGTTITLFSLEAYADGFLVTGRITREIAVGPRLAAPTIPELAFSSTDNAGRRYDSFPKESGGSESEWRFTHLFWPALDPAATELRLEVAEVRWRRVAEGGPSPAGVERGPWTFTLALREA